VTVARKGAPRAFEPALLALQPTRTSSPQRSLIRWILKGRGGQPSGLAMNPGPLSFRSLRAPWATRAGAHCPALGQGQCGTPGRGCAMPERAVVTSRHPLHVGRCPVGSISIDCPRLGGRQALGSRIEDEVPVRLFRSAVPESRSSCRTSALEKTRVAVMASSSSLQSCPRL